MIFIYMHNNHSYSLRICIEKVNFRGTHEMWLNLSTRFKCFFKSLWEIAQTFFKFWRRSLTVGDKFSLLRESEQFTKDSMKGQRRYFHRLMFFCLGSSFENDYFIYLNLHFLSYLGMAISINYEWNMISTWINLKGFYTPSGFLSS